MLVYGDRSEQAEPRSVVRVINHQLELIERSAPGLHRHSQLVGVLIEAGRLLQGIEDGAFAEAGRDRRTARAERAGEFLLKLARAVWRSWNGESGGVLPRLHPVGDWPAIVELREPEGFAFYAVYPEAYGEAARRLKLLAPPRVIGIRSIGTALGAIVAAALDAPPPISVRPSGDPFARKIALDPELERKMLEGDAHYVIVDEGPGQSGSSFGAVADWLTERAVPPDRIALLPSHDGEPGPAATDERRRWWREVQRQASDFGCRWPELVGQWCTARLGPVDGLPQDISAGAWWHLRYDRERDWPAIVPAWERRKFLVRARGEAFLAKFAGLGRDGEEKLAIAQALHSEGLVPEPIGLAHGFLIERWCNDAHSLADGDKPLQEIARYIARRTTLLPAMSGSGATADKLLAMARRNISIEFGEDLASALGAWADRTEELEGAIVRVRTDSRLDRHEWLRTKAGALIKTDALDHHRAHDLIGCQDAAWDVAGAIVEFDLDQIEGAELVAQFEEAAGRAVGGELLAFYRTAYLAFRLGQARLGATVTEGSDREGLGRAGDRYAARLRQLLATESPATRHESSLG